METLTSVSSTVFPFRVSLTQYSVGPPSPTVKGFGVMLGPSSGLLRTLHPRAWRMAAMSFMNRNDRMMTNTGSVGPLEGVHVDWMLSPGLASA